MDGFFLVLWFCDMKAMSEFTLLVNSTKCLSTHPCHPREVRNLCGEAPRQDHFAWDELEGDICVGIAWGRLGYKGSLCGEGVLRTGLREEFSVRVRV